MSMGKDANAYAWGSKRLCIEDCFPMHKECNAYA